MRSPVLILMVAAMGQATEPAEGRWEGAIQIPGNPLNAVIDLARTGEFQQAGKATAQLVVIGTRETPIPIDLVRQEGDYLTLYSSLYRMPWEGRVPKGEPKLTGTFAQGPMETPLLLERKP